eukprot:CAMPEP_0178407958 /NCGR_PEP_ID=MMETSP0689_2-20121128/19692_1 /TAXON_ID=160604 /ORGANISM="Amphidinium massartii, Strain CS-259" /LENGTH=852 /DNA_ID=CAMNT_0020029039 /DNA_START=89 /DNA_END=2646 /DNA_ORIENTATION=-
MRIHIMTVEEESGVPSGRSCEEEEEEDAKGRRDKNKKKKSKTKKKKKSKEKVKERPKKDQVASKAKVEKQQQKSEGNSKRRRQGEGGSFEVADGLPQQDQIHVVSETQKDSDEELWEYYAQCGQTTFLWPPVLTEAMAVKKAEAEAQESGTAMELVVADEQEEDGVPPLPPAPSPSPEEAADEEDEEEAQADEQEEAVEEAASPEVVSEADQGGDSPPEEEKETGEADGDDQQQPEGPDVSPPEEHPSPEAVPELPVQHHQAAPALAACPGTMEQESEATDVVDSDNVEEDLGDAGEESLQEEDEEVPQDNEVAEDESTDEHKQHRPKCKKSKGSKDAKKRKSRRSRGREKVASKAKTLKKEKGTKKRQHEKAKKSAHVKKVKHKKKKRKSVSSGTASEGDLDDAGAHTEESSAQLNEDDDDKDEDNSDAKDEDNSDAQESSAVQHSGECSGSESPAASTTTLKKKKKQGKSSTKHKVQGQEETSRSRRRSNDKPVADRKLTAAKSMPAKRAYQTGKESEKMLGPEALRKLICGVYARKNPSKLGDLQDLWEKYKGSELEVYHHVCKKYGEVPFAHMASEPEAAIVQVRPVENIFELARLAAGAEEGDHSDMDLKDEDRGIDGWPFVDEEYQANNTDSDSDFELYHPAKQSIAGASAARTLRPVATSASDLLLVPEPEQSKSRRCAVAIEDPTKLFAGSKALRALELEFEEELEKKLHNLEAVESPLIPESESDIVLSEEEGEDGDIEPSDRIVPDPLGTSGNNNEVPAETASLSSRALTERFLALVGQQVGETPVGPPEPKQAPKPCPSLCASTAMSAALLGAPWRAKPPAKAPPSGSAPPRPEAAGTIAK